MCRSTTDDPAVIAAMLPWRAFSVGHHLRSVRWSLCAREICFRNLPLRWRSPRRFTAGGGSCTAANAPHTAQHPGVPQLTA